MNDLVVILKKYNKGWKDKSLKEIENGLLWYALHDGVIIINGKEGRRSILLARAIRDIRHRLQPDVAHPDGKILWVEFMYSNCSDCTAKLIKVGLDKWLPNIKKLAFHRDYKNEGSYSVHGVRFLNKLLLYGLRQHTANAQPLGFSAS